jgi:glycosyltransferase involved in cell wall biosynthesis
MSCYNSSRWLHKAIESVLAQSFDDFELILINDGSIDETWNIIQKYSSLDRRVIAISKENSGLSKSLNRGIDFAKGTWIARLDADDICEPSRFYDQIAYLEKQTNVLLLGTNCIEIDECGQEVKLHRYPTGHQQLVRHIERMQGFFPHSSVVFNCEVVKGLGGYNPLFIRGQDADLWLRIASHGKIACLDRYLIKLRKHNDQISMQGVGMATRIAAPICYFLRKNGSPDPSSQGFQEWQKFLSWLERKIVENRVYERREWWLKTRSIYLNNKLNTLGGLYQISYQVFSKNMFAYGWERLFGSSLPKRLADEWMELY